MIDVDPNYDYEFSAELMSNDLANSLLRGWNSKYHEVVVCYYSFLADGLPTGTGSSPVIMPWAVCGEPIKSTTDRIRKRRKRQVCQDCWMVVQGVKVAEKMARRLDPNG